MILHNIQWSCTSWISLWAVKTWFVWSLLKSVWIRLRLSRSGFIRPAGSSLTSPLYGATRIFRPRPTESAENAYGLRTTLPIPSVHESFDLLSKAFTRRWGLLCFGALWLWNLLRCMYWVPMLPRLSRMKSAWWALTNKHEHPVTHWSTEASAQEVSNCTNTRYFKKIEAFLQVVQSPFHET